MLREEAIRKHRAMWNWIAEEIVNEERTMNIGVLKQKFIERQGDDLEEMADYNNCYLCEYSGVSCKECPLVWPSDTTEFMCEYGIISNTGLRNGLYRQCCVLDCTDDWKLQAHLACKIANLPEKGDE